MEHYKREGDEMNKVDYTSKYQSYYNTIQAATTPVLSGTRGELISHLSGYINTLKGVSFAGWEDENSSAAMSKLSEIVSSLEVKLSSAEGMFGSGEQAIVYLKTALDALKENETNYNELVDVYNETQQKYDNEPDRINVYTEDKNGKMKKTGTEPNPNKEAYANRLREYEATATALETEMENNLKEIEQYIQLIDQCDSASLEDPAISIPSATSVVVKYDIAAIEQMYPVREVEAATYSFIERAGSTVVGVGSAVLGGAVDIVDGVVNVAGWASGLIGGIGSAVTGGNFFEGFKQADFGANVDWSGDLKNAYYDRFGDSTYLPSVGYDVIQGVSTAVILTGAGKFAAGKLRAAPKGTSSVSGGTAPKPGPAPASGGTIPTGAATGSVPTSGVTSAGMQIPNGTNLLPPGQAAGVVGRGVVQNADDVARLMASNGDDVARAAEAARKAEAIQKASQGAEAIKNAQSPLVDKFLSNAKAVMDHDAGAKMAQLKNGAQLLVDGNGLPKVLYTSAGNKINGADQIISFLGEHPEWFS